ncbi:hypothetical protein E1265_28590 [Streptomyces sp. 8K308]|uniref:hypothetical protein n=1 Tax=Streptomyces sp. 8K308 TaxID=2530388 RepID=UPI001042A7FA|nr:hypothetical protein [Streptomyces sp. 8K308]TDC13083.1 hypothetical protein E1265_28590 [Streptomyces sp. 8K308]
MDTVTMNIAAHRDVEAAAAQRNRLASMLESAGRIGSDAGMFGRVPNGAQAAAALAAAIASVTQQVTEGGRTVDDIRGSANAAARIGEQSDQEAARVLATARVSDLGRFDAEVTRQERTETRIAQAETSSRAGGW